jgi:hypothetical protein
MSEIKFSCPQCQQHIQCDQATWGGREIDCPTCGAHMVVPGQAAAPVAAPGPAANACPRCHAQLPAGSRLCVQCGYNLATGQSLSAPSAPQAGTRRPGLPATAVARPPVPVGTSWAKNPMVWAGITAGVFVLLYVFARLNPIGVLVFALSALLYYVVIRILVIVFAFKDGAGTGMLTLCIEPYAIYFVYFKSENPMLKALYAIALLVLLSIRTLKVGME